LTKKLNL